MDWLADNKFYLNILFLILAVISFILILRPILFWYFGQNKILDQVKSLQKQIDQQNQAIEKLLNNVERAPLRQQALPAPQQKLEANTNNVVNISKEASAENNPAIENTKEITMVKQSKSHFERKEPSLKL